MILVRTFFFPLNSILGLIFLMETKCEDPNLVAYDATQIGVDAVIGVTWGGGLDRVEEGQTKRANYTDRAPAAGRRS